MATGPLVLLRHWPVLPYQPPLAHALRTFGEGPLLPIAKAGCPRHHRLRDARAHGRGPVVVVEAPRVTIEEHAAFSEGKC